MYDLNAGLDTTVGPGTNVLVSGPPLTGKRPLALDVLAEGTRNGDGTIVVTTKDSADRVLEKYGERVSHESSAVGVVDCVSQQQGVDDTRDGDRVKYASSPVDMTGIGIKLSEFLEAFCGDCGLERNRIMLHSLSTLLMYSDLQTVFRFLHVFTGRVQSVDGLGLFLIDDTAHDDRTMTTLKQLFDGVIRTDEEADPEIRMA